MPEDNNKNNNTNRDNRMFTNNYLDNQRKLEEEKKNNLNNSSSNNSEEVIGTVGVKTTTTYNVDATVKSIIETQVENQIKPDSFSGVHNLKKSPTYTQRENDNNIKNSHDNSVNKYNNDIPADFDDGINDSNVVRDNDVVDNVVDDEQTYNEVNGLPTDMNTNEDGNIDSLDNSTNDSDEGSKSNAVDKDEKQDEGSDNSIDSLDEDDKSENPDDFSKDSGLLSGTNETDDDLSNEDNSLDGSRKESFKSDNDDVPSNSPRSSGSNNGNDNHNSLDESDVRNKNISNNNSHNPRSDLGKSSNNDENSNIDNLRKNSRFNKKVQDNNNNNNNLNNSDRNRDSNFDDKKSDEKNKNDKKNDDKKDNNKKNDDNEKLSKKELEKQIKIKQLKKKIKFYLISILVIIIFFLILFLIFIFTGGQSISGLLGFQYIENNYPTTVEVIEVDGSTQHYNLEDYVAAVIANEAGFMTNSKYTNGIESLKAQAVAARTYAINKMTTAGKIYNSTNNQTNASPSRIVGNSGNTFESVTSPDSIFMQAANETRGLVLINDSGNLINAQYDAFAAYESCSGSKDDEYFYLCQMNQPIPKSWMDENAFQSDYYEFYKNKNHGNGMSQWGALYKAEQGSKFDEILLYYYGDHPVDEGRTNYKAQIYSIYRTVGMGVSQIDDYSPYITSTNSTIIPNPLNTIFDTNTLNTINNDIYANVLAAGPGTNEAVAIAATTLIKSFDNYGYKLPYSWAGGQGSSGSPYAHNDNLNTYYGINPFWGHQIRYTPPNGTTYRNVGLDCAGFVTWALRNAGVNVEQGSTGTYYERFANEGVPKHKVNNFTGAVEGDILWNDGHIMIVLQYNASNKSYIVAEAMGNKYGILINTRSHSTLVEKNYYVYSMKDYYAAHKNENYEEDFNALRKV